MKRKYGFSPETNVSVGGFTSGREGHAAVEYWASIVN